jgi:hypothetical protein
LFTRPSCSKAPRGLFVLSWVTRIFTGTSISPSPLSRQCSSRYSFRAGRNLPDKEFRYLRTVIVTAAVHRGFTSWLRSPLRFTFRHWAGVSPYMSTFVFAETCVFGKQSLEPISCGLLTSPALQVKLLRHPFFQRYGVNLPSSLTEVRSFTSGVCSLPTGVGLRYGQPTVQTASGFSWRLGLRGLLPGCPDSSCRSCSAVGICLNRALAHRSRACPFARFPFPTASPLHLTAGWCRILTPACHRLRLSRPRLRTRLTLG